MSIKIIIPGEPQSKVRHRCRCVSNRPMMYDPQLKDSMEAIKQLINYEFCQLLQHSSFFMADEALKIASAESLVVGYTFLFGLPRSLTTGQKNAILWQFDKHTSKPDIDNIAKYYSDCGNGIIWKDDAQITVAYLKKEYAENPRTEIEVMANDVIMSDINKKVLSVLAPLEMQNMLSMMRIFEPYSHKTLPYADTEQLNGLARALVDFAHSYSDVIKKIKTISKEEK